MRRRGKDQGAHWSDALIDLQACDEAVMWARTQPDYPTAWAICERGDWLLWLAERLQVDQRDLVRAACDCAETALRYVPAGEGRPAEAIRVARAWAAGEATEAQRDAAWDAAGDAAWDAAGDAAWAAAHRHMAALARARITRPPLTDQEGKP